MYLGGMTCYTHFGFCCRNLAPRPGLISPLSSLPPSRRPSILSALSRPSFGCPHVAPVVHTTLHEPSLSSSTTFARFHACGPLSPLWGDPRRGAPWSGYRWCRSSLEEAGNEWLAVTGDSPLACSSRPAVAACRDPLFHGCTVEDASFSLSCVRPSLSLF